MTVDLLAGTNAPGQSDMQRILSLPYDARAPDTVDDALVRSVTALYALPGSTALLRPAQALALDVVRATKGGLFPIGVGHGKTLVAMLASRALGMDPSRVVILVPSGASAELYREYEKWSKCFKIDSLDDRVLTYDDISRRYGVLDRVKPAVIIADEIHNLKDSTASRTRQFLRYYRENPETLFIGMTGTLMDSSLHDFAHLAEVALRNAAPIPLRYSDLDAWSACCDPEGPRVPLASEWSKLRPLVAWNDPDDLKRYDEAPVGELREIARKAFFNRFSSAPGVVRTTEQAISTPLFIREIRDLSVPPDLAAHLTTLTNLWKLPEGEEVDDPLRFAAKCKELAQGFYYRWVWPNGEPDREWLYARAELSKATRAVFKLGRKGFDTSTQILEAIENGYLYDLLAEAGIPPEEYGYAFPETFARWPDVRLAWQQWQPVKDRPEPPRETVWLSDYLVDDALRRAEAFKAPGIVWYSALAFAERLRSKGAFRVVLPGEDPLQYAGETIACSIASHGTGLNLQPWSHNLVISSPSSGGRWEQLIGRTHRNGQLAPVVIVERYAHVVPFRKAFAVARQRARFIEQVQGQTQKLNFAKHC